MPLVSGRPSRPIQVRFTALRVSREVRASSAAISSSGFCRDERGSITRRSFDLRSLSSRTPPWSIWSRMYCLRRFCSCVTSFLPSPGLGLANASISSQTCFTDTPCGSSVTTIRHWPRASCSVCHRHLTSKDPRPVS